MVNVIKANGDKEIFSEEKLVDSIKRAGISQDIQPLVIKHIKERLHEDVTTAEINRHIGEFLEQSGIPYQKTRYILKQAIMDLGPTGYPFEDFVAKILEFEGYKTKTRTIVQGKCISHEIDIIAERNTVIPTRALIEAKFHNQMGIKTNVHVPMYTKSRFEDVKEKNEFSEVWVITNTKATSDAIAFCSCVGMKIITWSYPEKESLRDLIEKYKLFPVTALSTLTIAQKQKFLQGQIVLCHQIQNDHRLLDSLEIADNKKTEVIQEIDYICGNTV